MSFATRVTSLFRMPALAALAALFLLTWTLAHWTWVFLTPRPQNPAANDSAPVSSKLLAEKAVALHLFGRNSTDNAAANQPAAAAPSNIVVRGVYAARDGRSGFAVLVLDSGPVSAVVGKEFAPGMLLQRVFADHVEILRNGRVESVRIATAPTMAATTTSPAAPAASAGKPAETPVPGVVATPAGNAGAVTALQMAVQQLGPGQYGFSRAAMLATLKRPDQMALLGRYGPHPRGGALLEQSPAGGLPEKLGLKVGDVIAKINGKSLSGPGDVARLYEQLTKSESVSVEVLRAGEKMNVGIKVGQ